MERYLRKYLRVKPKALRVTLNLEPYMSKRRKAKRRRKTVAVGVK